ncbi:uncharacterized protein LOC104452162 [Eucalyptus grandis]|uniref:Serine-rich protein-like protein n=1 Tax=Eucalyptus globulus TaxID=34317 RepID=A0ABD3KC38_EUCGL|nr:uncharacterized protein LOC104452162 [Eucalyptus grandis]
MDEGENHRCLKVEKSPRRKFTVPKIDLEEIGKNSPFTLSPRASKAMSRSKSNCLCSPTTHVGSFRCRIHRSSSISRGSSVGSNLSELGSKSSGVGDSVEAQ